MDLNSPVSLTRQAELLCVSRASLYTKPTSPSEARLALLSAVDEIYTQQPTFGTRRLCVLLERDYKICVGRDAIRSAMETLGLSAIYPKKQTSTAHPEHTVYPYLLRGIRAACPNHIWGTDITYIRLERGFCYLSAMLDWFSRKVLAWTLSNTLTTDFCMTTLQTALAAAVPDFHNSDKGSQFTSDAYLSMLKQQERIHIFMDGRGRCMDNIFTERLWRSVKYEDIFLKGYQTMEEVREGLTAYFDFYNSKRPHQSLGYKTPNEIYSSLN
ncbi:MAG: IS3 family transposase [Candidatus Eisenbacteria bacterium]|nr:IS3 family transposase [Candidatus Eisenbacteria bacterium]